MADYRYPVCVYPACSGSECEDSRCENYFDVQHCVACPSHRIRLGATPLATTSITTPSMSEGKDSDK